MPEPMHRIEAAPSGRASCRGCKGPIPKGSLRFAEEFQNPYAEDGGAALRYWHLPCAARRLADELAAALSRFEGEVEDRLALDALIRDHAQRPMPYAERASSGRARCRACDAAIRKGELRVAFERTYDSPMGPQKGAAYAHPACVARYLERERERGRQAPERDEVAQSVLSNSRLAGDDLAALRRDLGELTSPPRKG